MTTHAHTHNRILAKTYIAYVNDENDDYYYYYYSFIIFYFYFLFSRHIPKAKATTVAETPEFRRIAENTKIQSNVKYHEDFEKTKGKFTQVADDPETLRIKANSKNISNVAYHGELEKKAVMEKLRNMGGENGHNESN